MTSRAAAKYVGLTRQTLLAAVNRGEIGTKVKAPGTRRGYLYMFTKAELDAWMLKAPERRKRARDRNKQEGVG